MKESVGAATVGEGECQHHAEFAYGEERDEGERIHACQIGFAVGDIHRAPENAGAECGEDSAQRMFGGTLRRGGDREKCCASKHEESAAKDGEPAEFAGVAQFVEEQIAPEDAEQAVDVPEREGNAESDIANRENGQRVGDGPEAACEDAQTIKCGAWRMSARIWPVPR